MKIALVHDWLNQKIGGAENVFFELANMYPQADIYTLVYNPIKFDKFLGKRRIFTSKLNGFPGYFKNRPQLLLPFIKKSLVKWDFSGYDLVISSSTAWVKNISVHEPTRHICYCHSPARMLWDSWPGYLERFKLGPIRRYLVVLLVSKLRLWDYYQAQENVEFVANSKFVAARIQKFYRQPSTVIYPPVEIRQHPTTGNEKDDYYLIISILAPYKNIELAISSFIQSGKHLVIAGDGPDQSRLENIASHVQNIKFVGRVSDEEKTKLLSRARGFIFCSIEDFGITMAESIAAGTPVIALKGGGALEIIQEGKTGLFFDNPTESSLNRAVEQFEKTFEINKPIANHYITELFSVRSFKSKLNNLVQK